MATSRPRGVTVVAILAIIQGSILILSGVLIVLGSAIVAPGDPWAVNLLGLVSVVLGGLTIMAGVLLLRGNPLARGIATGVFLLNAGVAVIGIVRDQSTMVSNIISVLLAGAGIILLWSARANAFFTDRAILSAPEPLTEVGAPLGQTRQRRDNAATRAPDRGWRWMSVTAIGLGVVVILWYAIVIITEGAHPVLLESSLQVLVWLAAIAAVVLGWTPGATERLSALLLTGILVSAVALVTAIMFGSLSGFDIIY